MKSHNKIIIGSLLASVLALAPIAFAEDTATTEPKSPRLAPTMMKDARGKVMEKKEGKTDKKDNKNTEVDFATAKTNVGNQITAIQTAITNALEKLAAAKAAVDASTDTASLKKAQRLLRIAHVALAQALNGGQKPPIKGIIKKEDTNENKDKKDTNAAPAVPATPSTAPTTPTGTQ